MGLIAAGVEAHVMDRPGGIFVRTSEQMSVEDRLLQQSVARVILSDRRGSLADQVTRVAPIAAPAYRFKPTRGIVLRRRLPSALAHGFSSVDRLMLAWALLFVGMSVFHTSDAWTFRLGMVLGDLESMGSAGSSPVTGRTCGACSGYWPSRSCRWRC